MRRSLGSVVTVLAGLALVSVAPLEGTAAAQEEFHGIVERIAFAGQSWRRPFTIRIQAHTTDAELEGLQRLRKEQGAQALQDRLASLDLARLQIGASVERSSLNIGLVRSMTADDGGRVIRLIAAPRPLGGGRPSWRPDEIFSVIDLRLDEKGAGIGEYRPAVRIGVDDSGNFLFEYDRSGPLPLTVEAPQVDDR